MCGAMEWRLLLDITMEDQPAPIWLERLHRLVGAGAAGFRFFSLTGLRPRPGARVNRGLKAADPNSLSLAWTPGLRPAPTFGAGLRRSSTGVFLASLPWWEPAGQSWFVEENEALAGWRP